jgi:hypothetical protein
VKNAMPIVLLALDPATKIAAAVTPDISSMKKSAQKHAQLTDIQTKPTTNVIPAIKLAAVVLEVLWTNVPLAIKEDISKTTNVSANAKTEPGKITTSEDVMIVTPAV